jgi:GT2 family glycosyltransferase
MTIASDNGTTDKPLVSVIIVNFNGLHHLVRCLPTVRQQTYSNFEVMIVDNASTDGSAEHVKAHFPDMRLVETGSNLGYAGGNNVGFEAANGDYFAVLNPDTTVDARWLEELVTVLETHPAGLATSKVLLMDEPSAINACGNIVSLAGLTFCRGVGEPDRAYSRIEEVPAVSGAAFLVRRSVIEQIGPFDSSFVAYLEETDLSLRAKLAGIPCLFAPDSRVHHEYSFRFGEWKCFHLEKNRYQMLVKLFQLRTLLLLAPILLLTEALVWGYVLTKGMPFVREKVRSYRWLWNQRSSIRANRAHTQSLRRISDRELLQSFTPYFLYHQMVKKRLATTLYRLTTPVISGLSRVVFRFVT